MGNTPFTRKASREKLYASEVNAIYDAINNIEGAIVITPGTTNAQIPDAQIVSLDGSKLLSTSILSISSIATTGDVTVGGNINLSGTSNIVYKNGTDDLIRIGDNGTYSMIVRNGIYNSMTVSKSGDIAIRGVITALAGSSFVGSMEIKDSNISGIVTIGGADGVTLNGTTKQITVSTSGSIVAGVNSFASSGIVMHSGDINIADKFIVSATGSMKATDADIAGKITTTSGSIGGIAISSTGLSAGGFSLTSGGVLTVTSGSFTGAINATSGAISGPVSVTGTLSAGGSTLSPAGIVFTNGRINLGGVFVVSETGDVVANSITARGNITVTGGSFIGPMAAGDAVTISNTGIEVKGSDGIIVSGSGGVKVTGASGISVESAGGIKVKTGSISVISNTDVPVVTIGAYTSDEQVAQEGIVVNNGTQDTFRVERDGTVMMRGTLYGTSGEFTGSIFATGGTFGNVSVTGDINVTTGAINAGTAIINSNGIQLNGGSINLNNNFIVNSYGELEAKSGKFTGEIHAQSGSFTGLVTVGTGVSISGADGTIIAGNSVLDRTGIHIADGTITLGSRFSVNDQGYLIATDGDFTGTIRASAGYFGTAANMVLINETGLDVSTGKIVAGSTELTTNGLSVYSTDARTTKTISVGKYATHDAIPVNDYGILVYDASNAIDSFIVSSAGAVTMRGTIYSKAGQFGDDAHKVIVDANGIQLSAGGTIRAGKVTMGDSGIWVVDAPQVGSPVEQIRIGQFTSLRDSATRYGMRAGKVELTAAGLVGDGFSIDGTNGTFSAISGNIGGIKIDANGIFSSDYSAADHGVGFKIYNTGTIEAYNAVIRGTLYSSIGHFGGDANHVELSDNGLKITGAGIIEVDAASNGKIVAGKANLDKNGLVLYKDANEIIRIGDYTGDYGILIRDVTDVLNPVESFKVTSIGNVFVRGEIKAKSGSFEGNVNAGTLIIGPGGITVDGADGITIKGGAVKVQDAAGNVFLTMGLYDATNRGIRIQKKVNEVWTNTFTADQNGEVTLKGTIYAIAGDFLDKVTVGGASSTLYIDGVNKKIVAGGSEINGSGIILNQGSILLKKDGVTNFQVTADGVLTANEANITGTITAKTGSIAGISITENVGIEAITKDAQNNDVGFRLDKDGLFWTNNANISGTISAETGYIGDIEIRDRGLYGLSSDGTKSFTLRDGQLTADGANITGELHALTGYFGTTDYGIKIGPHGIYSGGAKNADGSEGTDFLGSSANVFYIAASQSQIPTDTGLRIIAAGDAYFKGSVDVTNNSRVIGDFVVDSGKIIAGTTQGDRIEISKDGITGIKRVLTDQGTTIDVETFTISGTTSFSGNIFATGGQIAGTLTMGPRAEIELDGGNGRIILQNNPNDPYKKVKLDTLGLYISSDGGAHYEPAVTGGGINANAINDGYLMISDFAGTGASGIQIQQWDSTANEFVKNIDINPSGIQVYNGAITVYSEKTGDILIGGGFLRVKGLDMGVVTSNCYIGNGSFQMVSDQWGLKRKNNDDIFMGAAHSSGGAVSNPSYHYAGWPDYGDREKHGMFTYNVDETTGLISMYNPDLPDDPNYPVYTRTSFNPQWTSVCPDINKPYVVIPNDACNILTVCGYDGTLRRHMLSWKGGLFGASWTPDGNKLIVAGDDIDRKRTPYDMVVFDTSSTDCNQWTRIGIIQVGEFPSKVVCDNSGYAYVTISLDHVIAKLNLTTMKVEKVITITDVKPTTPQPICISHDYQYIYVAGVLSDKIYEIPVSFDVPQSQWRWWWVTPWSTQRGIIHDIVMSPDGTKLIYSSASTTDGIIGMIDLTDDGVNGEPTMIDPVDPLMYHKPVEFIGGGTVDMGWTPEMMDGMYIPEGARIPADLNSTYNFKSSTTLCHHRTKSIVYVTVTNRCVVSIIDYSSGKFVEQMRIPSGSNPSGVSMSMDCKKLYVSLHHYHTYPLGANKIWGYRSSDYYYDTPEVFDVGQKYYQPNPSGMALTPDNAQLWVANRATNRLRVIRTSDWTLLYEVHDVGNKPYDVKMTHAGDKVIVANDNSNNKENPNYITVVSTSIIDPVTQSPQILDKIVVGEHPFGIDITDDDKFVLVACREGKTIQKVNIAEKRVVLAAHLDGSPKHIKIYNDLAFVSCLDTTMVYVINIPDMTIVHEIDAGDGPAQIEIVPKEETGLSYDKMYVVVQGEDSVKSYNISTYALIASVEVGSMPNPIKYNTGTNMLIVGNSGEGSLCYIDPMTDTVKEWSVTGDTPEFITCYSDGSRWFVTAHGPKDLAVYGEGTPYIGDAYLDNDGNTYQFGAAYWMPSRTEWIRSNDNQLTGYASVEFKPTAQLQDNKGYAMLNVSGLNVAYAQIEQDVYALENLSDGAAKRKYEIIDFPFHASTLVLEEEIAKYVGIDPSKTPEVVDAKTGFKYSEGTDYTIDYTNSVITRPDNSAIPDSYDQVIYLNGTTAVALVKDPALYNYVTVYDFRDPRKVFTEGVDYTVETVGASKVIRRKLNPDGTCAILNDIPIVMIMRQKLKVRYNYHTKGQNYDDVVLSADFFWRWPRPENQWVTMDLDELVPRFVIADNDNLESWTPTFDRIEDEQKGVTMSGATDRALIATPLSVGTITGDLRNPINSNDSDYIDMSAGAIYVLDLGAIYYLSKIYINRTPALGPISYSEDGITWVQVTDSNSLIVRDGNNVTITFPDTWTPINGDPVQYDTSRRIKYLKMAAPDGAACTLYNVKAFGDWKCSRNFTFSGFNLWDSEGAGEKFMSLSGVGSDDTTIRTNKSVFAPDRYKLFFPSEKPTDTRPVDAGPDWTWYSGSIQVTDVDGDIVYKEGIDFGWDYNRNEIWRKARTSATDTILIAEQIPFKLNGIVDEASVIVRSFDTVTTYVKDTDYTISDNSIVRTANSSIPNNTNIKVTYSRDSSIPEGTTIRVYYVYVQESMAGLPIAMGYRDPLTGKMYDAVTNPSIPQHSVCESDATGAWIEWEFENNYRCDLYAGWIADLGLGAVDVILDDEVVLSISQAAAQTERFSQFIPDIKPGRHKIRIQQVRGAINFDRFKLEDYQLYFTNTKLIASPIVNPTELFSWYTDKIAPGSSRKYLGQGSQTMSGAYDALRVDNQNKLPDNSVPIKYQVRIRTELRDKTGGTGGGGELGIVSGKFERGTVIVSNVNLEKGTIPTYWRMAPSSDKITGFSIEEWNITDPVNTGIHTKHIADGAITPNKIRPFTIQDIHIDTDAAIQESKLDLNFPTHEHGSNNAILAELNKVTGWGTSGSTYKIARADHNHDDVYVKKSGASGSTTITGDLILDGNVTIPSDHALKHIGEYEIVHRRPLYGIADDLQFQTSSTDWEDLVRALGLTQYAMPSPKTGATRYYRLYAIYSDDCTSDGATPRLRIMNETKTASIYEWSMPGTWSDERYWRRDAYSPFFSMSNPGHVYIQMRIQNDAGNFDNSVAQHDVGLRWLELIAYDVYES